METYQCQVCGAYTYIPPEFLCLGCTESEGLNRRRQQLTTTLASGGLKATWETYRPPEQDYFTRQAHRDCQVEGNSIWLDEDELVQVSVGTLEGLTPYYIATRLYEQWSGEHPYNGYRTLAELIATEIRCLGTLFCLSTYYQPELPAE